MNHTEKLLCAILKEEEKERALKVGTSFTPYANENETKGLENPILDGKNFRRSKRID